jgi:endoglucanase
MKIFLFIFLMTSGSCLTFLYAREKAVKVDFERNDWVPGWAHEDISVKNSNGILRFEGKNLGSNYQSFTGGIPMVDLTEYPFVYVKIKVEKEVRFELRILDSRQKETNNGNPVVNVLPSGEFHWIAMDFSDKFKQSWPTSGVVDSADISKLSILVNAGGNPDYTGWVEIEEIILGDSSLVGKKYDPVVYKPKVNQVGYLCNEDKISVIPSAHILPFNLINIETKDTVLKGKTTEPVYWPFSEETVVTADFSHLQTPGRYILLAGDLEPSFEFEISDTVYKQLFRQSIKVFYFNRASSEIKEEYGGKWARRMGHPDNAVKIHASATSAGRSEGDLVSSSGGWYDAGDYNKYVVPAGISTWQLLSALEFYPDQVSNLKLNLPESSNNLPDILDEVLWELDWLITMQDPADGGVYHKLTSASFPPPALPENENSDRYFVQKSTPAALHFAAILAKAGKILKNYGNDYETLSARCIIQAEEAWEWASEHPEILFDQVKLNQTYDPEIITGDYGVQSYNIDLSDDFLFAATELYRATRKEIYLKYLNLDGLQNNVPTWADVQFLPVQTMVIYRDEFPAVLVKQAETRLLEIGNRLLEEYKVSGYKISMGAFHEDYMWNSNGKACNQAIILIQAYQQTGNKEYYNAAIALLDYVLGRNPLDYCFVTGSGTRSPLYIHHNISVSDTVRNPIPGFLVNGPHNTYLAGCFYNSTLPAFTYLDSFCSSATNEVAIYDNSALVLAIAGIADNYEKRISGIKESAKQCDLLWHIYPNPNMGSFRVRKDAFSERFIAEEWTIFSALGEKLASGIFENQEYNIESSLSAGVYILQVKSDEIQQNQILIIK